jgi:hypothetical protein
MLVFLYVSWQVWKAVLVVAFSVGFQLIYGPDRTGREVKYVNCISCIDTVTEHIDFPLAFRHNLLINSFHVSGSL